MIGPREQAPATDSPTGSCAAKAANVRPMARRCLGPGPAGAAGGCGGRRPLCAQAHARAGVRREPGIPEGPPGVSGGGWWYDNTVYMPVPLQRPCMSKGHTCVSMQQVAPHGARLHACGCTHALACTPPRMAAVSSRQRACLDPRTCARTRTRCCCSCCAGAEPGRPCTEHALGGGQTAVTGRCARARMMLSLHARLAGRSGQRRALHSCELCCGRPHRRQPYGAQHACSSATTPKHLLNLHLSTQARTHAQMHARAQPCPHLHTRALRLLHLLRPPTPRRQLGLLSTHAPPAACSSHTT